LRSDFTDILQLAIKKAYFYCAYKHSYMSSRRRILDIYSFKNFTNPYTDKQKHNVEIDISGAWTK